MSEYQLGRGDSFADEIKRIVSEQISQSLTELEAAGPEAGEVIHGVRKRIQKIRAVLRLVRSELGQKTYRRENTRYRDISRQLSHLRDSQVLIETIDQLKNDYGQQLASNTFSAARRKLTWENKRAMRDFFSSANRLDDLKARLQEGQTAAGEWNIGAGNSFALIRKNVKTLYQRAYRAHEKAYDQSTDHHFHTWRKEVKYLRHTTRLLSPLWPTQFDALEDDLKTLSDYLGLHNDLSVLKKRITSGELSFPDEKTQAFLLERIEADQQKLRKQARPLSKRLFLEKPKTLVNRWESYWKIWQKTAETVPAGTAS
jgi:CHAD domain-containing protein